MPRKSKRQAFKEEAKRTLDDYIDCCLISENDPGLRFCWDSPSLKAFVDTANDIQHPLPPWISTAPGNMTDSSLKHDVIQHLAFLGGGSFGDVLVAPNNLIQFANVRERLAQIEIDNFVQTVISELPNGSVLATTAVVYDKANVRGTPSARPPPPIPNRLVFA